MPCEYGHKKAESHSECKLHLYKLFSPPCISPVCHTLPKRGWCAIQSKSFPILRPFSKSEKRQELLEVLTDLHFHPAKNDFQINQLLSIFRIEARKAWLASVSTVFHYTTLYWPDLNFTISQFHNSTTHLYIDQTSISLSSFVLKEEQFQTFDQKKPRWG